MYVASPWKGVSSMSTISSIANNTYMMYKFASKNGLSLTGGTTNSSSSSLASISSAYANAKSSSSSIFSTSAATSSAESDLNTLTSVREGYAGLVSSYTETKNTFNTEMKSTLSDLSSSASTVKNMNYDFSASDITTDSSGKTTYSDGLKAAISNVKSLVSDYNDTLSFFSDNKDVSKRASALATEFADTTYRADSYAAIGINVDSKTGALSVDEDKLAKALTTESSRTENLLGKNGLSGKAESHVSLAKFQQDKVFPSMSSMLGGETTVASLYTGRTLQNISGFVTTGNLINMLF